MKSGDALWAAGPVRVAPRGVDPARLTLRHDRISTPFMAQGGAVRPAESLNPQS